MPRVIHFEINSDQPERASKFYSEVFGWKIQKWDGPQPYWLVSTGDEKQPGINGGLLQRRAPNATTVNTVDVPSVDEFTKKVTRNGGKIVVPKQAIPGVGYLAYCVDTEGNTFGMMQSDPKAK
jgi:predicted enzyme related to lactoylglutathione lyase